MKLWLGGLAKPLVRAWTVFVATSVGLQSLTTGTYASIFATFDGTRFRSFRKQEFCNG